MSEVDATMTMTLTTTAPPHEVVVPTRAVGAGVGERLLDAVNADPVVLGSDDTTTVSAALDRAAAGRAHPCGHLWCRR